MSTDDTTTSTALCVLGCVDRSRTEVWPRPPRRSAPGLLVCRNDADRILTILDEVLELAVILNLVVAAGAAPRSGDGGRKRIKDEPVAPIPISISASALTDVRSRRGTWVPDAPTAAPEQLLDADGQQVSIEQLDDAAAAADRAFSRAVAVFGPGSDQARTAATELSDARARLRYATTRRPTGPRSIPPTDNDPASAVGFIDQWTDRVRIGRQLTGAGGCQSYRRIEGPARPGEQWPMWQGCGLPAEYRRVVRGEAGARTTGLVAVCPAGHVTRPLDIDQGDQPLAHRGAAGHRPSTGARHGLTIYSGIGLLRRHNEWICAQPWVRDYWAALRKLRADLGQAHGELRPSPIGRCPNGTGQLDEEGHEILCGHPLYASGYSDTIECQRCGRTWTHREWRFLGRTLGVIA